MRRRTSAIILVLALAGTSCGREPAREADQDDAPESDTTAVATPEPSSDTTAVATPVPPMEQTSECVNDSLGYSVRYPADWHENTGDILRPCSLFDPEPIEIVAGSEIPPEVAVAIDFEAVPFTTATGEAHGRRTISRERTTVDGRDAMRIRGETTGEGLYDRGMGMYQYIVDLGDTTIIATTHSAGSLPFDRKRRTLDAMMETFELRRDG